MYLPIRIKRTRKCRRCGLRFPAKEPQCVHCAELSDREVEGLKVRYKRGHVGNANLGRLFLYIAALIGIGFVIAALGL